MPKKEKTYTMRLSFRVSPQQLRKLKQWIKRHGGSITDAVRTAINLMKI